MEIISEPTYIVEDVVEWNFGTPTGTYSFIINSAHEDSVEFTESSIIVETHTPRETIIFNTERLIFYSQMPRKIKRKVEEPPTAPVQQSFTVTENTAQPGGAV